MSKYNRSYHLDFSPGATSNDKIANSTESLIGTEIVITEKVDGGNIGMVDKGVFERSHGEFSRSPWTQKVRQLHKFAVEDELGDGVYLFGEGVEAIHSIEYTNLTSPFYIFGIRDNNIWIPWEKVEEYSYLLDIPTVPVLFKGIVNSEKELKELVLKLAKEPSALGGEREGVVVRNAGMFHNDDFVDNLQKWVRKDHVTTDAHWARNWKKANIKNY